MSIKFLNNRYYYFNKDHWEYNHEIGGLIRTIPADQNIQNVLGTEDSPLYSVKEYRSKKYYFDAGRLVSGAWVIINNAKSGSIASEDIQRALGKSKSYKIENPKVEETKSNKNEIEKKPDLYDRSEKIKDSKFKDIIQKNISDSKDDIKSDMSDKLKLFKKGIRGIFNPINKSNDVNKLNKDISTVEQSSQIEETANKNTTDELLDKIYNVLSEWKLFDEKLEKDKDNKEKSKEFEVIKKPITTVVSNETKAIKKDSGLLSGIGGAISKGLSVAENIAETVVKGGIGLLAASVASGGLVALLGTVAITAGIGTLAYKLITDQKFQDAAREAVPLYDSAINTVSKGIGWLLGDKGYQKQYGGGEDKGLQGVSTDVKRKVRGFTGQTAMDTKRAALVNGLMERGLSREDAAAAVGNMEAESGLNPNVVNSIGAAGLYQLNASRKAAFTKKYGETPDKSSVDRQLDYYAMEWKSNDPFMEKLRKELSEVKMDDKNAEVAERSRLIMKYMERPSDEEQRTSAPKRARYAVSAYEAKDNLAQYEKTAKPQVDGETTKVYEHIKMEPGVGRGIIPTGKYETAGEENVDEKLRDIMNKASKKYTEVEGGRVEAISGYRKGDPRFHGKGKAMDVQIYDKEGNKLKNYQEAKTFRDYEKLAQYARVIQQEEYPELNEKFRFGGYLSGPKGKYGAYDTMHFDVGGNRKLGMGGGSWESGLTEQQRRYFPGSESYGLNNKENLESLKLIGNDKSKKDKESLTKPKETKQALPIEKTSRVDNGTSKKDKELKSKTKERKQHKPIIIVNNNHNSINVPSRKHHNPVIASAKEPEPLYLRMLLA